MSWISWILFAFAVALLLAFQFYHAYQNHMLEQQRRIERKELAEMRQQLSNTQRNLAHAEDIIRLIQEHLAEGILILDDSDKIQLANRTAGNLLHLEKDNWDTKSIFILTDNQDFLSALRKSKIERQSYVRETLEIEGKHIRTRINRVRWAAFSERLFCW